MLFSHTSKVTQVTHCRRRSYALSQPFAVALVFATGGTAPTSVLQICRYIDGHQAWHTTKNQFVIPFPMATFFFDSIFSSTFFTYTASNAVTQAWSKSLNRMSYQDPSATLPWLKLMIQWLMRFAKLVEIGAVQFEQRLHPFKNGPPFWEKM